MKRVLISLKGSRQIFCEQTIDFTSDRTMPNGLSIGTK
jgi:hypothetical protein